MFYLVVPTRPINHFSKPGRSNPFWPKFWSEVSDENRESYRQAYNSRKESVRSRMQTLNSTFLDQDKKYYVKAVLDEQANTKGKKPHEIWAQSGLKIVETKPGGVLTLSGKKRDFEKLENLFRDAEFDVANDPTSRKTAQTLSREIYAVSLLQDKNAQQVERLSNEIYQAIQSNIVHNITCILEVYYDRREDEYDALFTTLTHIFGESKILKRDTRFFVSNMSFFANLSTDEIRQLWENTELNFISYIKHAPNYTAQRTVPTQSIDNAIIGALLTNETVVVIDSGIDHSVINRFVSHTQSFLETAEQVDCGHGTSVTSRLLFGDDIFSAVEAGTTLNPSARIIDLRVLHRNVENKVILRDDQVLMDALQTVVQRHQNASIVNLSVAANKSAQERPDALTEFVDTLLNKNDLIVVSAVGNQNSNYLEGYEGTFAEPNLDTKIASPSDALNVISVGSIALIANEYSLCVVPGAPSPFTRMGGIRNDIKKPELVANGGNVRTSLTNNYDDAHLLASQNTYGVQVITPAGLGRDVGTSFSAPLVTREATLLLDYLKKNNVPSLLPVFSENKANLVKSLLIHSTERSQRVDLSDPLKRAYGFGTPSHNLVTTDNANQVTVIYADKINFAQKKHQLFIDIPESLLRRKIELVYTLTYNPPVNKNFSEYKMITLQSSLAECRPGFNEAGEVVDEWKPFTLAHSWDNYKASTFNTIHFKKKLTKGIQNSRIRVSVQMLVAEVFETQYLGREENITQNYAFTLTIRDLTEAGDLRNVLLSSEQFIELSENIQVTT